MHFREPWISGLCPVPHMSPYVDTTRLGKTMAAFRTALLLLVVLTSTALIAAKSSSLPRDNFSPSASSSVKPIGDFAPPPRIETWNASTGEVGAERAHAGAADPIIAQLKALLVATPSAPNSLFANEKPVTERVCLPSWERPNRFRCQGAVRELDEAELASLALSGNPFAAAFWLDSVAFERDPAARGLAMQIMLKRASLGDASMLDTLARTLTANSDHTSEDERTAIALRYAAWLSEQHGDADYDVRGGITGPSETVCEQALARGVAIAALLGWDSTDRARAGQNGVNRAKCAASAPTSAARGAIGQIEDRI